MVAPQSLNAFLICLHRSSTGEKYTYIVLLSLDSKLGFLKVRAGFATGSIEILPFSRLK